MSHDLYEILEIPDNATDAWIRRAYDSRRKAIAQDASLDEAGRQAQMEAVEHAFGVLTDPAARAQYDERLLTVAEPVVAAKKRSTFSAARITIYGTVLVILFGTAFALWRHSQYEEQMRIDQERVNAEIKARVKDMEARDKAAIESTQMIKTSVERSRAKQEAIDVTNKKSQEEKERHEAAVSKQYDPH